MFHPPGCATQDSNPGPVPQHLRLFQLATEPLVCQIENKMCVIGAQVGAQVQCASVQSSWWMLSLSWDAQLSTSEAAAGLA
jgi:hypothetical protein